ncbi:MAG: antibiotic biosynthesis monooxygenase [Erythrobacter sp.]|nr:MAG: antibiotic biosynthesis monooxygenase [Erythrobacter sp.]
MYLVVFRNRKRADIDQATYSADAAHMEAMAKEQPGYLFFKSYTADDGEVVALSEWTDEASARAWGRQEEHRAMQAHSRAAYYASYTLFACSPSRIHRFTTKDET